MSLQKLENEFVKIVLNPEIGGKLANLFSKRTGTEYLLGSPFDSPATPKYGDRFALEPANAQTDSLTEAIRNKEASRIYSNKVHQWSV